MLTWLYRLADRLRHRARRNRWPADLATGRYGEDLAHRFLQKKGYRVVARNYRPPAGAGEIDLVAWDGDTLVFIEVKTRASAEFGSPDRAVGSAKEAHVARVGHDFARRAGVPGERIRFDLVNVVMGRPPRLELVRDAFRISQTI
jgi:putative endonuclease